MIKWIIFRLDIILVFSLSAFKCYSQDKYFPLSNDVKIPKELVTQLIQANEPSLVFRTLNSNQFSYRQIHIDNFLDSMAIRLDIEPDGRCTLTMKNISNSVLVDDRQITIPKEDGQRFLALFEKCQFMRIFTEECYPTDTDMIIINNGFISIYEGVLNGNYNMFIRIRHDLTPIEDEHFQEMHYYFGELCERIL